MAPPQLVFIAADRHGELSHGAWLRARRVFELPLNFQCAVGKTGGYDRDECRRNRCEFSCFFPGWYIQQPRRELRRHFVPVNNEDGKFILNAHVANTTSHFMAQQAAARHPSRAADLGVDRSTAA